MPSPEIPNTTAAAPYLPPNNAGLKETDSPPLSQLQLQISFPPPSLFAVVARCLDAPSLHVQTGLTGQGEEVHELQSAPLPPRA